MSNFDERGGAASPGAWAAAAISHAFTIPDAVAPPDVDASDLAALRLFRLRGLERFWDRDSAYDLISRWEEGFAGLHVLGRRLVVLVQWRASTGLHWFVACEGSGPGWPASVRSIVAALPGADVRGVDAHTDRAAALNLFLSSSSMFGLIGRPTRRAPSRKVDSGLLRRLIRALPDREWGLLLISTPERASSIPDRLRGIASSISELSLRVERTVPGGLGTSGVERLPLDAKLLDIQEQTFRGLFEAARTGLWTVGAFGFAESAEVADVMRSVAVQVCGGSPTPVAAVPCDGGASTRAEMLLSSTELAVLSRPPSDEVPGFRIRSHASFHTDLEQADETTRTIPLGVVVGAEVTARISVDELTRHALIVGMTGSGKTTALTTILEGLHAIDIPYLVIEPVKREYRALVAWGARVYTIGDERTSPLRLNPFEVASGTLVQTHIDYLNALFRAAFVLYAPMPYVLERCLHEIYRDRGWDLGADGGESRDDRAFPTLSDLAVKIGEVCERLGYGQEVTMNVRAALLGRIDTLRLGAKGAMLDTNESFDAAGFLSRPTVVELDRVGSDEEKAFFMGLLLTRLHEHRVAQGPRADLQHVAIVEEAHRLLRNRVQSGDPESASPAVHAVEQFAGMLAEVRSLGQGLIIAEQIPSKLASDVVKNTALKLVFRTVASDDKEVIGSAINADEDQARALTSLVRGTALLYREGMDSPARIRISRRPSLEPPGDDALRALAARLPTGATHGLCPTGETCDPVAYSRSRDDSVQRMLRHALLAAADGRDRELEAVLPRAVRHLLPDEGVADGVAMRCALLHGLHLSVESVVAPGELATAIERARGYVSALQPANGDGVRGVVVAVGRAVREVRARTTFPFVGCGLVCPGNGCLWRRVASSVSHSVSPAEDALFRGEANESVRALASMVSGAGRSVTTGVAAHVPSSIGLCALTQRLNGLASDEVVEDVLREVSDALGRERERADRA